ANEELRQQEPELFHGLEKLRARVVNNPESKNIIERQFAMKNTMGYGLNSLLDYETPIDILTRLVIGSEGTLAFVSEAVFQTVPVRPHVATTLAVFPTLHEATSALPDLVATGAATLELMDSTSIK